MDRQQQFCLRWHNFQNTLLSSLPKLLDGGYLTDVTLSAGGRHIHAHRIILSACSYYFKELFKDLSIQQHPVIVLPGTEYADLCALVTFMYNGEVNIFQEQLPALLAMADTLHIRGLADISGKDQRQDNGATIQPPLSNQEQDAPEATVKKASKDITMVSGPIDSISTVVPENPDAESSNDQDDAPYSVKTKPYYSINAKLNQREKKSLLGSVQASKTIEKRNVDGTIHEAAPLLEEHSTVLLEDVKPPSLVDTDNTNYGFLSGSVVNRALQGCNKTSVACLICGKQLSNQYNLRVHMETHSNSSYSCAACSHVSRSRDALRKHVSYRHPVASPQKRPRCSSSKP